MAYLLSSERPAASAAPAHPLASIFAWAGKVRAERRQRLALFSLLELDDARLEDLGLSREDVRDAIRNRPRSLNETFSSRRAVRARSWFRSS
ncbi:hypothetical protein [Arsenicitalea aurantiaca]|nr:hypothetical protein [Arsenicitalea aurantiaca]